jgi:hypothetical protein
LALNVANSTIEIRIAKILRPADGARAAVAESLLLEHQFVIADRTRKRAPNLTSLDRFVVGWRPSPSGSDGPSWLTFLARTKDSLRSVDLFRCQSILLRSHWVMLVMDCRGLFHLPVRA